MSIRANSEIIEFMATTDGRWVRIGEVSQASGITDPAEFQETIHALFDCGLIDTERDPIGFRISRVERALAVVIGDEPRHFLRWIG